MDKDIYLVTETEFVVMAGVAGITSVYGFDLKTDEMQREDVLYALQDLKQKGYLKPTEKFELAYPMDEFFKVIKEADTSVELRKESRRACLLYVGDFTVMLTRSLRRKGTFEMSKMQNEFVWQQLQEEGWIPKGGQQI